MPILNPAGQLPVFLISDLVNEVLLRTENRTTDTDRAAIWLRDGLLELTGDPQLRNEFDELEVYGPLFTLTPNIQEYTFDDIVTPGDYNICTLDILLWTDPPTNSNRIRLDDINYQGADRITPFPGQPTKWYRYGNVLGFVQSPDKNYQVQAKIYRQHPIADDPEDTEILIGRNWNEILVYVAVLRGFIELMEYEKATAVRQLIYGDPKYPERVGIIESKKKRREKESWRRQKTLRPMIRSYGH